MWAILPAAGAPGSGALFLRVLALPGVRHMEDELGGSGGNPDYAALVPWRLRGAGSSGQIRLTSLGLSLPSCRMGVG